MSNSLFIYIADEEIVFFPVLFHLLRTTQHHDRTVQGDDVYLGMLICLFHNLIIIENFRVCTAVEGILAYIDFHVVLVAGSEGGTEGDIGRAAVHRTSTSTIRDGAPNLQIALRGS